MKGGMKVIYDNFRTICEKKNISIKQVERELGFSNSSICKWNECEPSVWKVQKVADYLGVSMEYLLSDQKEASWKMSVITIGVSALVAGITTKIIATYYFKKVDGYVKEMCEMTAKSNEYTLAILHKLHKNSRPEE